MSANGPYSILPTDNLDIYDHIAELKAELTSMRKCADDIALKKSAEIERLMAELSELQEKSTRLTADVAMWKDRFEQVNSLLFNINESLESSIIIRNQELSKLLEEAKKSLFTNLTKLN